MRRPLLLVPLLAALALVGLSAAGPSAAQTAAPSATSTPSPGAPAPPPGRDVSLADDGTTVTVRPGEQVRVRLPAPSGGAWEGTEGLHAGTPTLHLVQLSTGRSQELTATLSALSPGRFGGSSQIRPQRLAAQEVFPCQATSPPCATAGRAWSVQVVVEDGPTDASDLPCTPVARALPSPLPGTVVLTEADDGRTVTVPRDGQVQVYLDGGCDGPDWTPPRADPPLFREAARLDRRPGMVDATFRPQSTGTSTVTATLDARCLHRTDAAGDGTCAVAQRAYSVTVQVAGPGSPSPTPSACTKPTSEGFSVTPERVAAGDAVETEGGRRDLCREESQEPERQFVLYASDGHDEVVAAAVRAPYFRHQVRPRSTTTYRLVMDGRQVGERRTVVVDRTSGSCAGQVVLSGPARAVVGSTAVLAGRAPAGATVRVLFKRYGVPAYDVRRVLTAGDDGRFATSWRAGDDHRWYAATDRCDSGRGLTKAVPRITGPAVARRGETVTLRVEAVAGVRTTVFFRGAGEAFSARRTLTGSGTVTYRALRDQRYYALTRDSVSAPGLTQVR